MRAQFELLGIYMTEQKIFFMTLGKRLANLRKEQGMTQGELAEKANCSQQMIAEYEAGKRNLPVWRLLTIANILGVGVDDLLKNSESSNKKRGPVSRIEQLADRVAKLPRARQKFVTAVIENALQSV